MSSSVINDLSPQLVSSIQTDKRKIEIHKYGQSLSVTFIERSSIVATVHYLQQENVDAAIRQFLANGQITHGFEV